MNKNLSEFQSPRDPTNINVTKAFFKCDQDRLAGELNNVVLIMINIVLLFVGQERFLLMS